MGFSARNNLAYNNKLGIRVSLLRKCPALGFTCASWKVNPREKVVVKLIDWIVKNVINRKCLWPKIVYYFFSQIVYGCFLSNRHTGMCYWRSDKKEQPSIILLLQWPFQNNSHFLLYINSDSYHVDIIINCAANSLSLR